MQLKTDIRAKEREQFELKQMEKEERFALIMKEVSGCHSKKFRESELIIFLYQISKKGFHFI